MIKETEPQTTILEDLHELKGILNTYNEPQTTSIINKIINKMKKVPNSNKKEQK